MLGYFSYPKKKTSTYQPPARQLDLVKRQLFNNNGEAQNANDAAMDAVRRQLKKLNPVNPFKKSTTIPFNMAGRRKST